MSCGAGHRHGSEPMLLCLWRGPAAIAPIRPLAWELPYATGTALKRQKTKKKKERNSQILLKTQKEKAASKESSGIYLIASKTPERAPQLEGRQSTQPNLNATAWHKPKGTKSKLMNIVKRQTY